MFANKEVTEYLVDLSKLKIQDLEEFKISRKMRDSLISKLLDYYQLHFEDLGKINSLAVLREVFK
jgi:DNA repair protein RecO (recombination protein O)